LHARYQETVDDGKGLKENGRLAAARNCLSVLPGTIEMSKVLIVDDDREICSVLHDLLEGEGYQVRVASDGLEALEVLQRENGWVVFLDLMMPRMDGHAVIERLASDPHLQSKNKVVLMSAGLTLLQERKHLEDNVVQVLLPKPFDVDEVVEVVHHLEN
jgi:CheY-like chemotaxis protein